MPVESSRRRFLHTLALGGVAPLLRPPRVVAQSATAGAPSGWEEVRRAFAFREERVPMNAANLCPSPRVVAERVSELTHDIDVDCSFPNRAKFTTLTEEARTRVAVMLGVETDEVALVRNTSEANNIVNNGLPLGEGDEVVVWDQNHPTNNVAWDVRAARFGTTITRVTTPVAPTGTDELVGVFERALSPSTRVLALTHVSNTSGIRLPVRELCEVAHRRGIHVHVDGAQTWGALDVDLRALGCDSYTASAHKWFCGPKEVGLLYVRADRVEAMWPNIVAPSWGRDVMPAVTGARKFESMGQRDDAALAGLATAAAFLDGVGMSHIEARVIELAARLKEGLVEAGFDLVTPSPSNLSGGVVIAAVDDPRARGALVRRLYEEHGIAAASTGGLRLCPHLYNTVEHVDRAIAGAASSRRAA